jgi:hypothetical protein
LEKIEGLDRFCPTPGARIRAKSMKHSTIVEQMELGFNGQRAGVAGDVREPLIRHAAWWFERMRRAVDRALDWQQPQAPRPEQIWLAPQR